MSGLIVKSSGSAYGVLLEDGRTVEAHVKGNFRIKGIRSTNPVAVGDRVVVDRLPDGTNWITDICDRRNYIIRRATNLSKQSHILAANVDQVALIVTVNHPKTSTTFIDRFLATCEAYRVPAALIVNKIDLYDEDDRAELEYIRLLYKQIGYPVYCISAKQLGHELDELLTGKTTLLSGNSGVGKSTLLNALFGEEKTRTANISDAHDQGMHTTTFSEMYFLSPTTAVIDTPGIKGFGTFDMQREEVGHYFKEIFRIASKCRFGNCTHTNEPDCAVRAAVEDAVIAPSRYESYLSLLGDCTEGKYR
ncbi:MAG: ribosome small subunit-dependent GTPase A [Paludibacteraceae bacterium]|nr:ribosome small subunit-dependent GTPase A [Paludibacteraceae bacterium]